MAILIDLFPDRIATYMSYTEICFGLGFMLGPPLASHLYDLGGLLLPFEIVGIVSAIASFAVYFSLPNWTSLNTEHIKEKGSKPIKWQNVMKNYPMNVAFLSTFLCMCGFSMLEAMLESHMIKTVNASQRQVGNTFFLYGLCYMVINFFSGLASISKSISSEFRNQKSNHRIFMLLGL